MPVYKREGSAPSESWNELIRRVNELADECPDVTQLAEVEEKHRWSKSDIEEVQDKLKEICDENEFSDIPDKWKQSIIDEFEDAINAGSCCCEDKDVNNFPGTFLGSVTAVEGRLDVALANIREANIYDWADFVTQKNGELEATTITCPAEEGEPEETIEWRTGGGRAWWGREFKRWEVHIGNFSGPTLLAAGDLVDGYAQLAEGMWRPEQVCGEPPESGTPLGETDPAWGTPFVFELSEGPSGRGEGTVAITGADDRTIVAPEADLVPLGSSGVLFGLGPAPPVSLLVSDISVFNGTTIDVTRFDPFTGFFRLLCD